MENKINNDNINYQTSNKNMYQSYMDNFSNKNEKNKSPTQLPSKNEINIPRSNYSDTSYKDFIKICKAYYKEFKNVNLKNLMLSKDDIFVLNDLIKESFSYTSLLIKNSLIEEVKKFIKLSGKIVDLLLNLFHKNNVTSNNTNYNIKSDQINPKICYTFSLKLRILEYKFEISFNHENNYKEAEIYLNEIMSIQNILQLPKFNMACSTFYGAMIKFCKIV